VSVTAAQGFVAVGGHVGIKAGDAPDAAVVASDDGSAYPAAGVFTANRAAAAPVQVSRRNLQATGGHAAAVVLTSGNANAATGEDGVAAATLVCRRVAEGIGAAAEQVLIGQTGLIGVPFPIETVLAHLPDVVARRTAGAAAGTDAARAIMTTDTALKEAVAGVVGSGAVVGGMAKGAAMLAPNMATMLAVLTTDAGLDPLRATPLLRSVVSSTFNEMTVDGCTSTNDTVLLLASGRAGPADPHALAVALEEVCGSLAEQMVADAEGATKVAHITVAGAASRDEAHTAARKIADSLLVKCSFNGEDPYWGRVVSELGSAGVVFELDRVSVAYGGTIVCAGGVAVDHDARAVADHMAQRHIEVHCDLGVGNGSGTVVTADLGYGYIDENRTTS
jgi:glutamate N-acetyltransferase/amino-acid N-acetyltransferase